MFKFKLNFKGIKTVQDKIKSIQVDTVKLGNASSEVGIFSDYRDMPERGGTPPSEYMWYQAKGWEQVTKNGVLKHAGRDWFGDAIRNNTKDWRHQYEAFYHSVVQQGMNPNGFMKVFSKRILEDFQHEVSELEVVDTGEGHNSVIAKVTNEDKSKTTIKNRSPVMGDFE